MSSEMRKPKRTIEGHDIAAWHDNLNSAMLGWEEAQRTEQPTAKFEAIIRSALRNIIELDPHIPPDEKTLIFSKLDDPKAKINELKHFGQLES